MIIRSQASKQQFKESTLQRHFALWPVRTKSGHLVWLSFLNRIWNPKKTCEHFFDDLSFYCGGWDYYLLDETTISHEEKNHEVC